MGSSGQAAGWDPVGRRQDGIQWTGGRMGSSGQAAGWDPVGRRQDGIQWTGGRMGSSGQAAGWDPVGRRLDGILQACATAQTGELAESSFNLVRGGNVDEIERVLHALRGRDGEWGGGEVGG